jgi:hypothetical protein
VANVAPTGSKKSPAASAALRPVRLAQERLRREHREAVQRYKQELRSWKKEAAQAEQAGKEPPPEPAEPVQRQAFTTDTTREALVDLLQENPRGLLLYRDELTGWARSLNQYKGGKGDDKQFWLSLWSGEPVAVNRKGRRQHADHPFVSVCGNLPPGVLADLSDGAGEEDGFLHRILFSWPETVPGRWTDFEPAPETLEAYDRFFQALFDLEPDHDGDGNPRPHTLCFTPAGKRAFAEFVDRLADDLAAADFPAALRGPWSKMEGYCARLALLLYVCRLAAGETPTQGVDEACVDEACVKGAVRLADYFLAHARRVYPCLASAAGQRLREDAEAVLGWVRRNRTRIEPEDKDRHKPAQAFTWRMVRHDLHHRFEGREDDLRKALEDLEGRGYLREVPRDRAGPSGRKPKPDYFVHPSVWCTNDQNDQKAVV